VPVCKPVTHHEKCKVCCPHCVPETHCETYTVCVCHKVPYQAHRTVCKCVPYQENVTCTRMVCKTKVIEVPVETCNNCNSAPCDCGCVADCCAIDYGKSCGKGGLFGRFFGGR